MKSLVEGQITIKLDPRFSIQAVCKALYEPAERLSWDNTSLKKYEMKETSHPNVRLYYSQVRSKLQYAVKDFVEKRIIFCHDDAIYSYFSSGSE